MKFKKNIFVLIVFIVSVVMFLISMHIVVADNDARCYGKCNPYPNNPKPFYSQSFVNSMGAQNVKNGGRNVHIPGSYYYGGSWHKVNTAALGSGSGSGPGPSSQKTNPPCHPSCGECGGDGCGGDCGYSCGANFRSGCSSKRCTYYAASLTATANIPCISELDDSKVITISGQNTYCGDLTIKVDYGNNVIREQSITDKTLLSHAYSKNFQIPAEVDLSPEPTIRVDVTGTRNNIKAAEDEGPYDCSETIYVDLKYKNVYYCPKEHSLEGIDVSIYDVYQDAQYYQFNSIGYDLWEDCVSVPAQNKCTNNPTDCVDKNAQEYLVETARSADTDSEIEYCYSEDGIQGGWLDADILEEACNAIDSLPGETAIWLDCSTALKTCDLAIDDAPNGKGDGYVCCGDDPGENALTTRIREGTSYIPNIEYKACCAAGDTCVDNTGVCRQSPYEYCLPNGGVKAVCSNAEWVIQADNTCESACEKCDINEDGVVDSIDITAIDNQIGLLYNETYDINMDLIVDDSDYIICNDFFEEMCLYCGDDILSNELPYNEECESIGGVVDFQCPDFYCSNDAENNTIFDRTGCSGLLCNCKYEASGCDVNNCGGCAVDADCSGNQVCDTRRCSCQDYIVGGEVSMHIYETDCSYKVCVSGDELNGQTDVFKGNLTTNTKFERIKTDFFEQDDSVSVNSLETPTVIYFELEVTDGQDCFNFSTDDDVMYDFKVNGANLDLNKVYFETQDTHPTAVPFYHATTSENTCRICIPNEDVELTIDGKDNDCDGLVDEPPFTESGVYIWDANCEYFVCMYESDATLGEISSERITDVREIDWDVDDTYSLSVDSKKLTFSSDVQDDMDCLAFKSIYVNTFDIESDNIFIGYNHRRPLMSPFDYANPVCALGCDEPGSCGTQSTFFGQMGCDPGQCLFDCGGYWTESESSFEYLDLIGFSYMGDYCEECEADMNCVDYNNEYSCHYDPCSGAESRFGCSWNTTSETCEDIFEPCVPGTTLCDDGFCRQECEIIAGCNGYPDGECEVGEGCDCEDCELEKDQASCVTGAVCDSELICGCPEGTTMCNDWTCDADCDDNDDKRDCINHINNGICEFGEGCACEDCFFEQGGCVKGISCDYDIALCNLDLKAIYCIEGTALCQDFTCDETCENNGGKQGCQGDPNGRCELFEGCACEDCYGKRDSCDEGLVCDADDELCDDTSSGGDGSTCVDSDSDGYYRKSIRCTGSDDCVDTNANVNPGMLETCDGIDNNCDGEIDEACEIETMFTIESSDKIRILDEFEFNVEVRNNQQMDSNIKIEIETPTGIGAISKDNYELDLKSGTANEVKFRMYVRDYKSETANIILRITKGSEEFAQEIPIVIEIPKFLIAQDPSNKAERCKDFYFVLNDNTLDNKVDMEINIINPDAFLGKTLLVDYMSRINVNGIVVEELLSNPYCLDYKDNYEIHGNIYQASSGFIMSNGPRYMERISQEHTISKVKVKVNIK